jgi:hypothetical protein
MTNEEAIKWIDAEIHRAEYINTMWLDCVQVEPLMQIRELLTAHQPRVLTLEDATGDEEVWFEFRPADIGRYADCYMHHIGDRTRVFFTGQSCMSLFENTEYNRTWRCWTSRPTDEQRKATPWNEPPKEE